jgi:hypothetical protein
VYIAKRKAIKAKVCLYTEDEGTEEWALLDSGATESFIHPTTVEKHKLTKIPLKRPRKVRNVDNTTNRMGSITEAVILAVRHQSRTKVHQFLVADIGDDSIILGFPFFEAANPLIEWSEGHTHGNVIMTTMERLRMDVPEWENGDELVELPTNLRKTTMAQHFAEQATDKKERSWKELVPARYHHHGQTFSEQASERFPGPRKWDHAIDLKPDAPTSIDCRVYPLSPKEREEQKKFLEGNLRLQRIRRSNSPYASGFFLIKKKDGKFRPVQDYRRLNKWTIPNKYPLPLISELIHDLAGKKLFSCHRQVTVSRRGFVRSFGSGVSLLSK